MTEVWARKKQRSEPTYGVKFEGELMVPMRDGVHLAADVYLPDTEEKFPALLAYGPWSKELASDLQWVYPPQPPHSRLFWTGSIESGNSEYIVSRGYAHVMAQVRGLGHSEGMYESSWGWVGRPSDAYDLVEWIAKQPWCDGNVGMVGISAFAAAQLWTAIQQPPHLKSVFCYDTPGDLYRDGFYDGGVLSTFSAGLASVYARNGIELEKMEKRKALAREIRSAIISKKADPLGYHIVKDIMLYPMLYAALIHPQMSPWIFDLWSNPFDDQNYREKSFCTYYDSISVPAYCGSGWYAWTYTHLAGAFRNYEGLTKAKAKKLIVGPAAHGPGNRWYALDRPFHQYHDEILRWHDYWLKGLDTGIMDEPPVKIFVMGVNRWRYENEWPLARTRWTKLYLRTFGRLLKESPKLSETAPDVFAQQPLNTTDNIARMEYRSAPLSSNLEITGPIALYLNAAIEVEDKSWVDANWIASLGDEGPDGTERELTRGWLKASHRAIDPQRSKQWQPYHPHSKESVEKIDEGKVYQYAIELRQTSNVFLAGHKIKLTLMSADLPGPIEFIPYHLCRNDVVVHKIYRSREHPSYLVLPTIPETDASKWIEEERASELPALQP
jgi:uncharacterized protein